MARISAVVAASHSPFLYTAPEQWSSLRRGRDRAGIVRADVPVDTEEENRQKYARCMAAFEILRGVVEAADVDVLVVFGDDQGEQFNFANFPAVAVFCGERFEGYRTLSYRQDGDAASPGRLRKDEQTWTEVLGHSYLAKEILAGLVERDFDPAFCLEMADDEVGMGHAFMRPLYYLSPAYDVPVVPISVNCYYAPQPSARRCRLLGEAIREIVEQLPDELNVGVVGSGGLWHTPRGPGAWLDEDFDRQLLSRLVKGDDHGMAALFDERGMSRRSGDDALFGGATGMRGGLGAGTGEIRNWIAAAGVAAGRPGTVVDYVPVYASPCGMGFAYWSVDG